MEGGGGGERETAGRVSYAGIKGKIKKGNVVQARATVIIEEKSHTLAHSWGRRKTVLIDCSFLCGDERER